MVSKLKYLVLVLAAVFVTVAYSPVSVLASKEFISIAISDSKPVVDNRRPLQPDQDYAWYDGNYLDRKAITITGAADGVQTDYQLKLNVVNNWYPITYVSNPVASQDSSSVYGIIGNEVFWFTKDGDDAPAYIYKTDFTTGVTTTLTTMTNGARLWEGLVDNNIVWAVGKEYVSSHWRSCLYRITSAGVTAIDMPGTDDCNQLVGIETDGTYIIAGERQTGGLTNSTWPDGGGLWQIPIATYSDTDTWSRVYEDPDNYSWTSILYRSGTWYALLNDCTTNGRVKVIHSSNLTDWTTDLDYTAQNTGQIHTGTLFKDGTNIVTIVPVASGAKWHMRNYNGTAWSDVDLGIALSSTAGDVVDATGYYDGSKIHFILSSSATYTSTGYTVGFDGSSLTTLASGFAGVIQHTQSRHWEHLSSGSMTFLPLSSASSCNLSIVGYGGLANIVSCNGKSQNDFDDLRFTKSDGSSLLDYWIESSTSGISAVVWVEFDSIPANPDDATFYMYYGNVSAIAASNGASTFPFFDDFPGSAIDTNKWTGSTAAASVSGSILTLTATTADKDLFVNSTNYLYPTYNIALRMRSDYSSGGANASNGAGLHKGADGNLAFQVNNSLLGNSGAYLNMYNGSTWTNLSSNFSIVGYSIKEIRRVNGSVGFYDNDIQNTNSPVTTNLVTASQSGWIHAGGYTSGTHIIRLDWILIRNFTTNEPVWQAWGAEEEATVLTKDPTANTGAGWTDPANAYDDDADYAYETSGTPATSNTWGTYGFSLSGATINRVRVRYDAYSAGYSSGATSQTSRPQTPDIEDTASSTKSTGTTFWGLVDETVADDGDYYEMVTNGGGHVVMTGTAFTVPAGATIANVTVYYRAGNVASLAANIRASILTGTTYNDTADAGNDPPDSPNFQTYSYAFTTNPATGAAWTYDEVNGSDATTAHRLNGYGTASNDCNPNVRVSQVYAVCYYTPASEYDDLLKVDVSWDGGTTWSNTQNTTMTSAETTYWYDVTSATAWTSDKLSDANLKVRALAYTVNNAEVVRLEYLPVEVVYIAAAYAISNDPATKAFGVVTNGSTLYAKGAAPANPVTDDNCTFTLTNSGVTAKIQAKVGNFTGTGATVYPGAPDGTHLRITIYASGTNPASGLVLTNADQDWIASLAAGTKMWDFKFEPPTSNPDDPNVYEKSGNITLTAVAP